LRPLQDRVLIRRIEPGRRPLAAFDGEDLMILKESDILGVIEQSVAKQKAA
jgi:co-chaperonin GroES (HSP10)